MLVVFYIIIHVLLATIATIDLLPYYELHKKVGFLIVCWTIGPAIMIISETMALTKEIMEWTRYK